MEQVVLYIIKIGGNVIDHPDHLLAFLNRFAAIPDPKILVHGGGKLATRIGEQLGIVSQYIEGRRITDDATLDLVTMVYGGLVNKKLVASLQAVGCNAIGLTGADANIIPAVKRPVKEVDYGWAGDINIQNIHVTSLQVLLQAGIVPVMAPLTHDGKGHMLNTNADTIAASLAVALSQSYAVQLMYCFEKKGVLADLEDPESVIPVIHPQNFPELKKEGKLHSGIIPKIENALEAVSKGVQKVWIGDAADILKTIKQKGYGTYLQQI
jgi:acetylglutamate kinase